MINGSNLDMLEMSLERRWLQLFWKIKSFGYNVNKISEHLVKVLRLVDGDEKPSMGYLYEAMDKAKENIKSKVEE